MKIALISPYNDIPSLGIRIISSYLKNNGHHAKLIFLPIYNDSGPVKKYDESALKDLILLCDEVDVIGITLMTNFLDQTIQITEEITAKLSKPVIWGGIHPTIMPKESLKYADMVCLGEGEDAILGLLNSMGKNEDYTGTQNFWFKRNGSVIKNPLRPLVTDIDVYPMPDYEINGNYILFENKIQKLSHELLRIALQRNPTAGRVNDCGYQTMTSRGCPNRCSYCANDMLKSLYREQRYFRWRGVEQSIEELLHVKETMPYVKHIWFSDDDFFAQPYARLQEFCTRYKEKIGLPFFAFATPLAVTEEKVNTMIDAGLQLFRMGIETGSSKMQELFNRKRISNKLIMEKVNIVNKCKKRIIPPEYDFLVDAPYETDDDKIQSLKLISQIPKPFSLTLYPGTVLYEKTKGDYAEINYEEDWNRHKMTYLNFLFLLSKSGKLPGWLLRMLVSKPVLILLNNSLFSYFFRFLYFLKKQLA